MQPHSDTAADAATAAVHAALFGGGAPHATVVVKGHHGSGKTHACRGALSRAPPGAQVIPWDPQVTALRLPSMAGLMGGQGHIVFFADDIDVPVLATKGGGTAMAAVLRGINSRAQAGSRVRVQLLVAATSDRAASDNRALLTVHAAAACVIDMLDYPRARRPPEGPCCTAPAPAAATASAQGPPALVLGPQSSPQEVRTAWLAACLEACKMRSAAWGPDWGAALRCPALGAALEEDQ